MENLTNQDNYKILTDYKKRLATAKVEAEKIKTARITGEATIKQLQKNEQEIIDKIKALGYDPDKVKDVITTMVANLGSMLAIIENTAPDEDGNIPDGKIEEIKAKLAGTHAPTPVVAVEKKEEPEEAWSF